MQVSRQRSIGYAFCSLLVQGWYMKNQDELKGKSEAMKGKLKEAAGDLTDDDALRNEGLVDEAAGKTQDAFGRTRRKVGDALDDIADDIKR